MNVYINYEYFEVVASKDLYAKLLFNRRFYYDDIHDAYARPSQKKIDIYYDWMKWFDELDTTNEFVQVLDTLKITARNSDTFSLIGWIIINDIFVVLYITKAHNRAVVVSRERAKDLYKILEAK